MTSTAKAAAVAAPVAQTAVERAEGFIKKFISISPSDFRQYSLNASQDDIQLRNRCARAFGCGTSLSLAQTADVVLKHATVLKKDAMEKFTKFEDKISKQFCDLCDAQPARGMATVYMSFVAKLVPDAQVETGAETSATTDAKPAVAAATDVKPATTDTAPVATDTTPAVTTDVKPTTASTAPIATDAKPAATDASKSKPAVAIKEATPKAAATMMPVGKPMPITTPSPRTASVAVVKT